MRSTQSRGQRPPQAYRSEGPPQSPRNERPPHQAQAYRNNAGPPQIPRKPPGTSQQMSRSF